jgi:hydroxymethylpyrimidine pyrophosphatase-like HAD family hydrolase
MIKLIIMDLDRTLLNDEKNISEYTAAILEECKAAGLKTADAICGDNNHDGVAKWLAKNILNKR